MACTVLVCQNTTCSQQGSAKVLAALQLQVSADTTLKRSGCLGECGSGPMVLVLPQDHPSQTLGTTSSSQTLGKTWYSHVQPADVPMIVSRHLQGGEIVRHKLYPKYHPKATNWKGWLAVTGVLLALMVFMFATFAGQSYYF